VSSRRRAGPREDVGDREELIGSGVAQTKVTVTLPVSALPSNLGPIADGVASVPAVKFVPVWQCQNGATLNFRSLCALFSGGEVSKGANKHGQDRRP